MKVVLTTLNVDIRVVYAYSSQTHLHHSHYGPSAPNSAVYIYMSTTAFTQINHYTTTEGNLRVNTVLVMHSIPRRSCLPHKRANYVVDKHITDILDN